MKKRFIVAIAFVMTTIFTTTFAQVKIDQERMDRDIEIAENALSTMIKQKFEKRNMWIDVKANYTPGFGVTMRLPNENSSWIYEGFGKGTAYVVGGGDVVYGNNGVPAPPAPARVSGTAVVVTNERARGQNDKERAQTQASRDSARAMYYGKVIEASRDFIADYGDLISQLQPNEKILITNRAEGGRYHYDYNKNQKRLLVTVEGTKGDISQYRQGKLTRDQVIAKIKIVNTESTGEVETDLELFSSIIGRLYRSDLAKTYYTDENIYYERLKDFGVIYYLQAYSGIEMERRAQDAEKGRIWRMPTQRLEGLTQEQRDKKVVELYPLFEKELKDNMVEYGQTIKSLKEGEMLVFNVTVTKCTSCNIPSNLELSLRFGDLKDLAAGKTTKADVASRINVKKGPNQ